MGTEKGNLTINSENIFPIIKKWMYSDHDIFIRELVSNACDAITKMRKLEIMGEYNAPADNEYSIQVIANPTKKTLKVVDNGIGMTKAEVKEYINQIAFSGATDFLNQYKDKANEDQIIGHFGLGFYSAFMVAQKVTIDTLSYKDGSKAVHWECDGGTVFEMSETEKEVHGTEITVFLNEDCYEFSNEYRVKEVLNKYCSFMPEEIYFVNTDSFGKNDGEEAGTDEPTSKEIKAKIEEENANAAAPKEKTTDDDDFDVSDLGTNRKWRPINDPHPLWTSNPSQCTEADYKEFYTRVFNDYQEPLFWIHLNMDYPFNLKGILYFPRLNNKFDTMEGIIKLYNNQVFVADNIKEVIPDFLMLLKGVIDCPDLPLNVSRSALQNDGFVSKIQEYITKKIADKLAGMFKVYREEYEKYWDDISPFIKLGCIKDEKFRSKMMGSILYKNIKDKYLTLEDCLKENEEKHENTIFYITNKSLQTQYIKMFKDAKIDAVYMEHLVDTNFINLVEQQNENVKFLRIDTNLDKAFQRRTSKKDQEVLNEKAEVVQEKLRALTGNAKLEVRLQNLKNENTSAVLTVTEESKRMEDMMYQMGMMGMDNESVKQFIQPGSLVLNNNNVLVQYILGHMEDENTGMFIEQIYDLAKLGNEPLTPEEMTKFVERSNKIMLKLSEKETEKSEENKEA